MLDKRNYKNYTHDSLSYFKSTSNTDVGVDDYSSNAIGYVKASLFNQNDGAIYKQAYSDKWVHEIFGDYRTGQIAVRGKNSGTWQSWRTILDSSNYSNYAAPLKTGTATGTSFSLTLNAYSTYLLSIYNSMEMNVVFVIGATNTGSFKASQVLANSAYTTSVSGTTVTISGSGCSASTTHTYKYIELK
jgi:hypothetical protein